MTMTDKTVLFKASCRMIKSRQHALLSKERQDKREPIPPTPAELPSKTRLHESSANFRLYAGQARDILRNITELRDLVLKKRRDYVVRSGGGVGGQISIYGQNNLMSDNDRREFDANTDFAMRQCGQLIKSLKQQVEVDNNLRKDDEEKHLKMIIQLLSVYLKDVCKIVAQLREIHLKKTQNLQRICRLANLVDIYQTNLSAAVAEDEMKANKARRLAKEYERTAWDDARGLEQSGDEDNEQKPLIDKSGNVFRSATPELDDGVRNRKAKSEGLSSEMRREIVEGAETTQEPTVNLSNEEQKQLMVENEELFMRFSRTNNDIQRIEKQMNEIKRLQDTFSEKVLEQEAEIEQISVKTMHTLDNLEAANDFIRQAIQNSAGRRVIALFCLIVMTFSLLFLDWYNP